MVVRYKKTFDPAKAMMTGIERYKKSEKFKNSEHFKAFENEVIAKKTLKNNPNIMGEAANDIIYGAACSGCYEYFNGEHGYPVLCESCWHSTPEDERENLSLASIGEIGGFDF